MESLIEWISQHASQAHWIVFVAILIAGANIPISVDALMIISAVLAATVIPEHALHFFLAIFVGCCLSAWLAYWIGRTVGRKLLTFKYTAKLLPQERLEKISRFYTKYGPLTLILGRFIPFGVRNCIFMSSGMSKLPFGRFILWDTIGCLIWSSLSFYTFYTIGKNYELLYEYVKNFNIFIIVSLGVSLIALFWYKNRKNRLAKSEF